MTAGDFLCFLAGCFLRFVTHQTSRLFVQSKTFSEGPVGLTVNTLSLTVMESVFEKIFYSARWIIAPLYLGLSLGLLALTLKFFQEVVHVLPHVFELSETDLILSILSMVDMGLVGGLVVMVMYSSCQ